MLVFALAWFEQLIVVESENAGRELDGNGTATSNNEHIDVDENQHTKMQLQMEMPMGKTEYRKRKPVVWSLTLSVCLVEQMEFFVRDPPEVKEYAVASAIRWNQWLISGGTHR